MNKAPGGVTDHWIDIEVLREFTIKYAITVTDESGIAIDCVQTDDLVNLYERLTGLPFYRRPEYQVPE